MYNLEEPTDSDWCGMGDHSLSEWINPETGWRECQCGMFTEPVEGEPHDEYSAYCTDLIDAYLAEISKAIEGDFSYVGIQSAKMRILVAPMLRHKAPEYLKSLIASAKNSNSRDLFEHVHPTELSFDIAVALGTHLGYVGKKVVDKVVEALHNTSVPNIDDPSSFGMNILNEETIGTARTAAEIYNSLLLDGTRYMVEKAIISVCPLLEEKPDLIPAVANLYNTQGITESTTERVLVFLSDADGVTSTATIEGAL